MNKYFKHLLIVMFSVFLVAGCTTEEGSKKTSKEDTKVEETQKVIHASLTITENNGKKTLLSQQIELKKGDNLLNAMKKSIEVKENKGYVTHISGVEAKEKESMAWFFRVNGEESEVGANKYIVKDGDIIEWDLHSWKTGNEK